ncbi:polysaccharide deacetylase family protein [Saccharospirillum impatiens]|uniref:polysaccharide deacetylase family protein n=1 Tax=Saccharospirillum impatiens TaxID=169438 RepID=UPI00041FFE1C|nr:polysaccharide deacetylase family protein [Saccharospirillum impatiens]
MTTLTHTLKQSIKRPLKAALNLSRDWRGAHRKRAAEPTLWVLMYHRVLPADDPRCETEEPGMVVTPETFRMHLQEIQRWMPVVALGDWVQRFEAGEAMPEKACAITFDDGWLDNYQYAYPELKQQGLVASIFAVADRVGQAAPFWPNRIADLVLRQSPLLHQHPVLAPAAQLLGQPYSREAVSACIQTLKQHSEDTLNAALNSLGDATGSAQGTTPDLMPWPALQELDASGVFAVGSHTCTHRRLNHANSPEQRHAEIVDSRQRLEQQLGHEVPLFCFPNGDYDEASLTLVREHYQAAVTTKNGLNRVSSLDLHQLNRIGVHEGNSRTTRQLRARLSGLG